MIDELRMAELLCTRLCHDLTGPIGAVNNGAEFLGEEGFSMQNQAVELIISSAFSAVTRLQFYRMAYGKVRDHGEASLGDKQKLASDFFADTKITLDWPDSHTDAAQVSISLKMARLIYNLLLIAADSLIRGGTISVRVSQEAGGGKQVAVAAQGGGLKWDAEMQKIFGAGLSADEMTPKNVQACLTRHFAGDLGTEILCQVDGERLTLQATQPG